jgi:hypothetical protein
MPRAEVLTMTKKGLADFIRELPRKPIKQLSKPELTHLLGTTFDSIRTSLAKHVVAIDIPTGKRWDWSGAVRIGIGHDPYVRQVQVVAGQMLAAVYIREDNGRGGVAWRECHYKNGTLYRGTLRQVASA